MNEICGEAYPFTLEHAKDGRAATAAEAVQFLVYVLLDPQRARNRWVELDAMSLWILVLAVMAHPVLRDEVWPSIGDEHRINAPDNQGVANDLVRRWKPLWQPGISRRVR